jgi:hypothetical protein
MKVSQGKRLTMANKLYLLSVTHASRLTARSGSGPTTAVEGAANMQNAAWARLG